MWRRLSSACLLSTCHGGLGTVATLSSNQLLCPWDCPGKNTGVGCRALLQGIFPTQGSNPGLPHCRRILYHLSHQGSPCCIAWPQNLMNKYKKKKKQAWIQIVLTSRPFGFHPYFLKLLAWISSIKNSFPYLTVGRHSFLPSYS